MAAGWPRAEPGSWAAAPSGLDGSGTNLLRVLDLVPTRRLVVLGESGAGKTIQLLYLVRDLLRRRQESLLHGGEPDPVPVLVPLASWDPSAEDLYSWMLARLAVDYPVVAESAPPAVGGHTTMGQALRDRGWLLPILDGFDELPAKHRGKAIEKINEVMKEGARLVLSSRTAEFREAIQISGRRLLGAAGIELGILDIAEVKNYIRRDARGELGWADRWDPVLTALNDPAHPVTLAFHTPLMVSLACDIYNPGADQHDDPPPVPAEICGYKQRAEVETHLLRAFIPAAYRRSSKHPCPWTPRQAEEYLIFLAYHLEHTLKGAKDLAWWELARRSPTPSVRLRWSGNAFKAKLPTIVPFALATGALFGVLSSVLFGARFGLLFAPASGLICGLAASLAVAREGVPADLSVAANPRSVLARDRNTFFRWLATGSLTGVSLGLIFRLLFKPGTSMVVSPLVGGVVHGLTGRDMPGLVAGLLVGLIAGLAIGIFLGYSHSAWGTYIIARCRMALQRRQRLPWRLMSFLADAHQPREVLRQAGAYYQFRHRQLQQHLAQRYI